MNGVAGNVILRSAYVRAESDQGIPIGRFKTDAQTDLMAMTCLRYRSFIFYYYFFYCFVFMGHAVHRTTNENFPHRHFVSVPPP